MEDSDMNELDDIQTNHRDERLLNDVINNNNTANAVTNDLKSLKGTESPTPDDTDGDALSPRKHHMLNNHHNNNDVSFVLIVEDQAGEDLHSGDEEVNQNAQYLTRHTYNCKLLITVCIRLSIANVSCCLRYIYP